ncbi:MAG: hypothetical protein ACK4WH_01030 [Phycisphaerales bacterium]
MSTFGAKPTEAGPPRSGSVDANPLSPAWWAKHLSTVYGPYAFGVICLMVIWTFLVKPELQASRLDRDAISGFVHALDKIADRFERAAERIEKR